MKELEIQKCHNCGKRMKREYAIFVDDSTADDPYNYYYTCQDCHDQAIREYEAWRARDKDRDIK